MLDCFEASDISIMPPNKVTIPDTVLVRELQGLGLEVKLITEEGEVEPVDVPKVRVQPVRARRWI